MTRDANIRQFRWVWFVPGLAVFVLVLDQATKWWAESALEAGRGVPVLGELIQWRLVYNPGAAFGIAADHTWVLTILAVLGVVALTVFAFRVRSVPWAIVVGVLLGGAVSHLGDRLFRPPAFARGHIVDFIDYFGWFVGNVADIAIVGGAVALGALTVLGVPVRAERSAAV